MFIDSYCGLIEIICINVINTLNIYKKREMHLLNDIPIPIINTEWLRFTRKKRTDKGRGGV